MKFIKKDTIIEKGGAYKIINDTAVMFQGKGFLRIKAYDTAIVDAEEFDGVLFIRLYGNSYLKDCTNINFIIMHDNSRAELTNTVFVKKNSFKRIHIWNITDNSFIV